MPEVCYTFEVYYVPDQYGMRDDKNYLHARFRNQLRMIFATNDEIRNSMWARKTWLELKRAFPEPYYYVHAIVRIVKEQWINDHIDHPDFDFQSYPPHILPEIVG